MLAAEDALAACYARCHHTLEHDSAAAALDQFIDESWQIRAGGDAADWKHAAMAMHHSAVHRQLLADPYTRDAFTKPRGYPGDADTLDYVYEYRGPDGADDVGRSLFAVTTSAPIARAVRSRCVELAMLVSSSDPTAVVVSVGAGHMRELHQVQDPGRRVFVAIDHDAQTLQRTEALHPSCQVVPFKATAREFVSGRIQTPPGDLIYSAGLFDYLRTPSAIAVLGALFQSVKPGGLLVVANLTAANPEIAYMETAMDWWMQYRAESELLALVGKTGIDPSLATTHTTYDGRVAWLNVRRR
jgi:extracellular factor (EF) 3-hydroxypalmitic acid methyl ester biosynthesis protein